MISKVPDVSITLVSLILLLHRTGDHKRWENSFCLHYVCLDRLFQEAETPVPLSWCHTSSLCQELRRCQLAPPQGYRYQMTLLGWMGIKSPGLGPWNTVSARCLQPCGWFFSCCCPSASRPQIRRQVRNRASRSKGPWPLVSFIHLFIHSSNHSFTFYPWHDPLPGD